MVNVLDTTAVALRKGTREENETFVGIQGEATVDLGNPDESGIVGVDGNVTLRIHNGYTPGGIPLARADMKNMSTKALAENRPTLGDKNLAYADLENLERTPLVSAQTNIRETLSSYGLATRAELDNYAKKNMSNVDTADLAENNGHSGTNLAYADFSNCDTSNLTMSVRPDSMRGPVLAENNFSNVTRDTWTSVTNRYILPIVQEGVEFTSNKDEHINEYVIEEGHYPSTEAVVEFVNTKASDHLYMKRDFSNVEDWGALYYSDGEVSYRYDAYIVDTSEDFVEGETYITDYIMDSTFGSPIQFKVTSVDEGGAIALGDVEIVQYIGEIDLTGKALKIISPTNVEAYIQVVATKEDEEDVDYRYVVDSVSCPSNAGFMVNTYENRGEPLYLAQRLYARPTEVDEYGRIVEVEAVPGVGTVKIYDDEESGDDNPKSIYVYTTDENKAAVIVVHSVALTPEIGGAGVLKTNLTNLPGMTESDVLMEEYSDWWIRHDLALPSGSGELTERDTYRIPTVREVVQAIENGGGGGGSGAGLSRKSLVAGYWELQQSGLYHYVVPDTKDVVAVYRSLGNIYTLVECDIDNDGTNAIIKSKDAFNGFCYVTADEGEVQTKGTVPLLSTMWADHQLNDQTWLRADTFSWQSGDTYKAAYEKLLEELEHSEAETDDLGVSYFRTANGYKIILSSSDAAAANAYATYGVAWYYIVDTENRRFKLPRTKYSFTGIRTTVGNYVEAGAPNITGQVGTSDNATTPQTGAFYSSGAISHGNGSGGAVVVQMDASRSSSIYGNSDTVQPPAIEMYLYFYVGNFSPEATEVNAGINVESLNNKVDRSDLTDVNVVIETYKNGSNWYRIWSDGWIEQGGTQPVGANVEKILLKPFTDTDYTLVTGTVGANSTDVYGCNIKAKTTTSFTTYINTGYSYIEWYACGY